MAFELPDLPYAENALDPHISERTVGFHYGKHHAGYVANLNGLVAGTPHETSSLEDIIVAALPGALFNNAAPNMEPHLLLELDVPRRRR